MVLLPDMMGKSVWFFREQLGRKVLTSLVPRDTKGRSGVSSRTFHAMVGHFFWPHVLRDVDLSLVPDCPGNSVIYLMLCDNFLSA